MNDLKNASGFMCHLHPSATLAITAMAKEMKEQGHDVCSMCAGEPDFDTPQPIKDACIAALEAGKVTYTPASGAPELRKLLAAKFQKENGIRCAWDEIVVRSEILLLHGHRGALRPRRRGHHSGAVLAELP